MPYIAQSRRGELEPFIASLDKEITSAGELNYAITKLCLGYLVANGNPATYASLSAVAGVIQDVRDEFVRRMIVPYENRKREENGDVYPPEPPASPPKRHEECPNCLSDVYGKLEHATGKVEFVGGRARLLYSCQHRDPDEETHHA